MMRMVRGLGQGVVDSVVNLGAGARLFGLLLAQSGLAFRRLRLTIGQIHFIGNYSLIIIVVSGLFVGFVLGLQGYNTLQRYGAEQALGLLVALSLVRELGPVITALLFAGRAGTSIIVTHDVEESLAIVDYVYFLAEGKIVAQGTPDQIRASELPYVRQFVSGAPDGPVRFHYPAADYAADLGLGIDHGAGHGAGHSVGHSKNASAGPPP